MPTYVMDLIIMPTPTSVTGSMRIVMTKGSTGGTRMALRLMMMMAMTRDLKGAAFLATVLAPRQL